MGPRCFSLGHGGADCLPGSAGVLALPSNGSLTAAEVQQISWPDGSALVFNVDYH